MNQSTISTMCTISEVLRKTLENLAKCDFTRFKYDLWNRGPIPRQRLEEATVEDTVTMLVQTYTRSNCGPVVLDILRNMNFNQLALDLEKSFSCGAGTHPSGFSGWPDGASYSSEDSASCCSSSSFQSSIFDTQDAEFRIVMVGKTGAGKSSTGNTILGGCDHFHAEFSPESVTATCERRGGEASGRWVAVVDTPGLFDTALPPQEMKREIEKCVEMSVPGPHVFLLVISLGRFTDEERNTVRWIQENFGPGASRHTIVLFTGGDRLKGTIEHFLSRSAALRDLVQSCQNRYHVFDNEKSFDNRSQVTQLLEKIEALVKENGGRYYTNAMYQQVQQRLREEEERQRMTERMKEKQKQKIEDKIKTAENLKTLCSTTKDLGLFVVGKAEEEGLGDEAFMMSGLLGVFDYMVEDCNNDLEKLWRKHCELD